MAGDAAKLNPEIIRINNEITHNRLSLRTVYTMQEDFTPIGLEKIRCKIDARNYYIAEIQNLIGKIKQMTLPSGQLVNARKEWIQKGTELEQLSEKLKKANLDDLDMLQKHK